jgi:uncharacterized protein (TIGR02646 family)
MHKFDRGEAPLCLQRHHRTSSNDWKKVTSEDKTEIWEALQAIQLDRCAYCENKITISKQHIEHFFPRSRFPQETFAWSNLFGSCNDQRHCGTYKDNKNFVQSYEPADLIKPDDEDPEKLLLFVIDGTVAIRCNLAAADQHRAAETIRVFNLNAPSLKNQRRQAVQGYLTPAEDQFELSDTEWLEYIDDELQEANRHAFVTAIRHILIEPDARSHLSFHQSAI